MSALRDHRTPAEVAAATEMRRQHLWPWPLLSKEVWHLSENTGVTPWDLTDRLGVPWQWIAEQYATHHEPLPWHLRAQLPGIRR